jgi:hypothetical protein
MTYWICLQNLMRMLTAIDANGFNYTAYFANSSQASFLWALVDQFHSYRIGSCFFPSATGRYRLSPLLSHIEHNDRT